MKLAEWLQAATIEQRALLCSRTGLSSSYLYQIANDKRVPTSRAAHLLVAASELIERESGLPALTLDMSPTCASCKHYLACKE